MDFTVLYNNIKNNIYHVTDLTYTPETRKEYNEKSMVLRQTFYEDCVTAIMCTYSFNRRVANKIFNKAYENGHSAGYYEVYSQAMDICDFVDEILDIA